MFNVVPRVDVPGFRVRPVKDPPGFDIDEDGLPRRSLAGAFGGPPPNVGPYGGGVMFSVVPLDQCTWVSRRAGGRLFGFPCRR
jgi:hypothetical protein